MSLDPCESILACVGAPAPAVQVRSSVVALAAGRAAIAARGTPSEGSVVRSRRVSSSEWRRFLWSDAGPSDSSSLLVALALAERMDPDGSGCYPPQRRLEALTRLGRKTVWRCLRRLEGSGSVRVIRSGRTSRGWLGRNFYLAVVPVAGSPGVTVTPGGEVWSRSHHDSGPGVTMTPYPSPNIQKDGPAAPSGRAGPSSKSAGSLASPGADSPARSETGGGAVSGSGSVAVSDGGAGAVSGSGSGAGGLFEGRERELPDRGADLRALVAAILRQPASSGGRRGSGF